MTIILVLEPTFFPGLSWEIIRFTNLGQNLHNEYKVNLH